jgi:hypothetical protein
MPDLGPDAAPADAGFGAALEASALCLRREGPAPGPEKRGLIRRLRRMPANAVLLFLDATILRLFPPLRFAWAFKGEQAEVKISGRNAKRVLFGVLNPRTGHRLVLGRFRMRQEDFQAVLRYLRQHYPGRPLWLLLDRAPCHEAGKSQQLAARLGIELLWLPKQCSELNAMDQLWKELKRLIAANRQFRTIDQDADYAERWLLGLTPRQALRKAGVLSDRFWLKDFLENFWPPT